MAYDCNTPGTSEPTNRSDHVIESLLEILWIFPSTAFPIWWSLKLLMSDHKQPWILPVTKRDQHQLQNMLNSTRVSIASYLWSIGGQTHKWTTINFFTCSLLKTNWFHVPVHVFSNGSQMTSKRGKKISDTLGLRATLFYHSNNDILSSALVFLEVSVCSIPT